MVVSVTKTEHFIRHLKPRMAADSDGIKNIIIYHLPRLTLKFTSKEFNYFIRLNFAKHDRRSLVIMFHIPRKQKKNHTL